VPHRGACFVPTVRSLLFAAVVCAVGASSPPARAVQMGDPMGEGMPVEVSAGPEMAGPALPAAGPAGDCGCRGGQSGQGWQQPPWHGNVQGGRCGAPAACCRGSNVFQAHPFQQLQWKHSPCVTLPPHFPRLHTFCREGYMPTPVPPAVPRCHQCGAAIEGGF